jgi:hypothetical protein
MTNIFEQNLIEIRHQALDQELKLRERKFYSRNDIEGLKERGLYLFLFGVALGALLAVVIRYV